jgi:hypothetical protein
MLKKDHMESKKITNLRTESGLENLVLLKFI